MAVFRPGKPWNRYTLTSNKVVPAGTTMLGFDVADGDPPATGAPPYLAWFPVTSGLYLCVFNCGRQAAAPSAAMTFNLVVSGVRVAGTGWGTSTANYRGSVCWVGHLTPADKVEWEVAAHPSVAQALSLSTTNAQNTRIGPVRWT